MKAIVYHGPGQPSWEDVPRPTIQADTDAVVRVDATTICGTDLHILKGDLPTVTDGRILGHEAVGTVETVGAGVKNVKVGDRVLVSCITACGACRYCREGVYGQCTGGGGWILGNLIDGTHAEFVRVPFADTSTYPMPSGAKDEDILMLSDIVPTGYEVGVLNGRVRTAPLGTEIRPGVFAEENVEIHPSALVTGPVYLGSGVKIAGGTQIIGPTVLRSQVVVDAGAVIDRSIVWRNT